ncbi:MAG: serine/threonine protein kinase, partial [Deltaproteobacteria bacterium]|nr:serine/threonine protein kinase [Deltaproteobacteria bacterium]
RESGFLRRVQHPHLVRLLDTGTDPEGRPFLVQELVEGPDLARRLDGGSLPPREAALVTAQVAAALDALHAAGIAHRDVTPANVILGPQGAVLADLGLSHGLEAEEDLTAPGHLPGTVAYLPPEALDGRARPGPAGDVYMLGVLLWHMLAGRLPWLGATPAATLLRLLLAPPVELVARAGGLPEACRPVLARALAVEPEARPASAGALAAEAGAALGLLSPPSPR